MHRFLFFFFLLFSPACFGASTENFWDLENYPRLAYEPDSSQPESRTAIMTPDLGDISKNLQELLFTRQYEAGVINRLLIQYIGRFDLNDIFAIQAGLNLSTFEQWGYSLLGVTGIFKIAPLLSEISIGVQQENWPDWSITENRAVAFWTFEPFHWVSLMVGCSYRAPQYGANFLQSFQWPTVDAEWGPIYRLQVNFFEVSKFFFSFLAWNYDRMRFYSWDNVHFSFQTQFQIHPKLRLEGLFTTATKGVSGGIVSWGQNTISLGINYAI